MRKRDNKSTGGDHSITRKVFPNNSLAGAAGLIVMPSLDQIDWRAVYDSI